MKLYAVRHEKRFSSPVYETELTPIGKQNAISLSEKINAINPDYIYVSPFVRTLQTIEPYCQKYNKKIIVTQGLIESHCDKVHTKLDYNIPDHFSSIIANIDQTKYNLHLQETSLDVKKRIICFLQNIEKKHHQDTVLCVTHMSPLEKILMVKNIKFDSIPMGKMWGPIYFNKNPSL